MKVNLEKSRMLCSSNVDHRRKQQLSDISGFSMAGDLGKYLGIPLLKGRVTIEDFAPIIDKINSRLTSWKGKLLNKAGRLCLAKSVLSSLPVYTMQSLWLPEAICDHVDKMVRNCIWSKGCSNRSWNLVAWKDITQPKDRGGLGIRSARLNNEALLGKLVESMLHEKDKLWVRVLSDKYLKNESVLNAEHKQGESYVWRGIVRAKTAVANGYGVSLGDGSSSLWYSDWLGTGPLASRVPFVHITDTELRVADLWQGGVGIFGCCTRSSRQRFRRRLGRWRCQPNMKVQTRFCGKVRTMDAIQRQQRMNCWRGMRHSRPEFGN